MPDIQLAYKTIIEKPRTGPVARFLGLIGAHPALSGFIGGVCVVLIAMASAFGGVKNAPVAAMIISAIVVLVWTILVWLMGGFFARQAVAQIPVRRDIEAGDDEFRWLQDGEELARIAEPVYEIFSKPAPAEIADDQRDQPRPVWLVVSGEGGSFVLETKLTAAEALEYDEISGDSLEVDETLPRSLASRILNQAERSA
jgi:hypothetical protein